MSTPVLVCFSGEIAGEAKTAVQLTGVLLSAGKEAQTRFAQQQGRLGLHLLLCGDRDYYVRVAEWSPKTWALLQTQLNRAVTAAFPGRYEVRRRLAAAVATQPNAQPDGQSDGQSDGSADEPQTLQVAQTGSLNLQEGIPGATPISTNLIS